MPTRFAPHDLETLRRLGIDPVLAGAQLARLSAGKVYSHLVPLYSRRCKSQTPCGQFFHLLALFIMTANGRKEGEQEILTVETIRKIHLADDRNGISNYQSTLDMMIKYDNRSFLQLCKIDD